MQERVWAYLVVSSDEQAETLPEQRRWCLEEAAKIGAAVRESDIYQGVATGKHGARKILLDIITKLQDMPKVQRPQRVLMVRLDRTGRMPLDAISAINDIRKLGVIIRTRKDGDLTFARMADMVGPIFELLQAGFDNEVRSDKTKAGYARRKHEGKLIPTKPPYGIMRDGAGFGIPDPECAPFITELFQRWVDGASPHEIVNWLRATAPPRKSQWRRRFGQEYPINWSLSHVYKVVKCRTYRGVIVPEYLWDQAQHRGKPASRPGPGGNIYPFTGMRCSCGERLHPRTNAGPMRHVLKSGREVIYQRKKRLVWYVCQSLKHESGPKFRSFNEEKITEQWVALLRQIRDGPSIIQERSKNLAPRIADLDRRLDLLQRRRNNIHLAFEGGGYGIGTLQERLADVEREESGLLSQIEVMQREYERQKQRRLERNEIEQLLCYAARIYERASREEQVLLNRAFFKWFGYPAISDDYRIHFPDLKISRRK